MVLAIAGWALSVIVAFGVGKTFGTKIDATVVAELEKAEKSASTEAKALAIWLKGKLHI